MKYKTTRNAPILEQEEGERPKRREVAEGERKPKQFRVKPIRGNFKESPDNKDKCHMEVKEKEY